VRSKGEEAKRAPSREPPYLLPLTLRCAQGGAPYAVKEVPHPQPPVAFGLLTLKPLPCMAVT